MWVKSLAGIFLGCVLYAGRIWKGDIMVADIEEVEEMDASELHAKGSMQRNCPPMKGDNFKYPVADGTVKISGGDQRLRTSTSIRARPERREEQEVLRRESDELSSPTPLQADSTRDDAEAQNDFWSISGNFTYRHHVEPRVKLYVPREESFPIPMKYIDVTRNTHTSLDVMMEKILMITATWMEKENYQMHGQVSQDSCYWTKGHLTDTHGLGED